MENFQKFSENSVSPKQLKAIKMLAYQGLKKYIVAEKLGITPQTLSNWLNPDKNPAFVEVYDKKLKIAEAIRKRDYKAAAPRAIDRLIELMDDEKSDVALRACKEILDRAGDKPAETVNVNTSDKLSEIFEQIGGGGLVE